MTEATSARCVIFYLCMTKKPLQKPSQGGNDLIISLCQRAAPPISMQFSLKSSKMDSILESDLQINFKKCGLVKKVPKKQVPQLQIVRLIQFWGSGSPDFRKSHPREFQNAGADISAQRPRAASRIGEHITLDPSYTLICSDLDFEHFSKCSELFRIGFQNSSKCT